MRYVVFVTTLTRLYKFHEVIRGDEKTPYLHVSYIIIVKPQALV